MASAETESLECDPHPTTTVDSQAGENEQDDTTMASPETEAFESDPYATAAVGFVDAEAFGSDSDGGLLASMKTEHLELDPNAMAAVDIVGMQGGGSEHDNSIMVSGEPEALECYPYATASVSTVDLGGSKHDDTIVVSAERVAFESNRDAVAAQAGGSEHDGTVMAAMESEASGCNSYARAEVDFGVSVEEGNTRLSFEAQNVHEEANILVPGDDEVSVAPIQHLEQEVTQSSNMVSNHEGSFPAGETVGDGTFDDNQEEIQGEEHVFDISEFDIGSHDVPMTGAFFGEHCTFPALDTDKAEAWHGPGDVILEDRTFEHGRDQHGIRDAIAMETSSGTIVSHDVVGKLAVEEKMVHNMQSQMNSETLVVDAVHGLNESSSMQDSHVQCHDNVVGHQCNEADSEHAGGLALVVEKGVKQPSEDIKDPDAQETHLQGDADDIFVSFSEENMEVVQPQTTSSEDRFNTNSSAEEVENEGNLLNTIHKDAAVRLLKLNRDMHGSSPGLGVESTNTATELHLNTQDTVVGSRIETLKSHEGSITQTFGNEENECTDSHLNEISAPEQSVEVGKDALLNEKYFNSFVEAANAEPVCALANSILSNEISMEGVVPVAESLLQEERITFNEDLTHDKVMLNSMELEVGPVVSDMEVDKLHIEQKEKQIDDPLLMGVKSVEESDGNVLDSRQSDGEDTVKDRGKVIENTVAGREQEKKEQEELCLKPPVDSHPLQASIAEEAKKQDLTAEMTMRIANSSDLKTSASSCSGFSPANELPGSLNNDEKPVLQSLEPSEESKGKRNVGSPVGADSSSKKQLKKHIDDHKSPMPKGGNKLDSSIVEVKEGGKDDSDDGCSSEPDEELPDSKLHKPHREGNAFGIGDLVWAKVRSHPWWPAQIFDPADASKSARKAKKSGRVLVAFFGDCTFAWLQQSQMIAFRPNFKEKVKQTTLRIFCIAVEEALEEICRRSELGLSCVHFKGSLHSTASFPDANTGIREGVRVKWHKDICSSVQMFRPDKTLEFVKGVACSPLGVWCSTLKLAELRGHVYGLRTCMVASGGLDSAALLSTIGTAPSHGSKLKRSYSSLETNGDADAGSGIKEATKMKGKRAFDGKGLTQNSKKAKKVVGGERGSDVESKPVARKIIDASEGNKDSRTIKFKVSKKIRQDGLSSSEGLDTAPGQGVGSEKSSDDGRETLLALAGSSVKVLKRSSSNQDKNSSSSKKKVHRKTVGESQNRTNSEGPDSETAASPRTEAYAEDAFAVTSSLSEEKVSNAEVKRRKDKKKLLNAARSPVSSIDAEDLQEETQRTKNSKVGLMDETKKAKFSKTLKEVEMKKEVLGNDLEASKKRKFSKVGDSIMKVASELTGTPVAKCSDDFSAKSTGPGPTIKMKDSVFKLQASSMPKKVVPKESVEDVSLLQLRQDLELLANKIGGGSGKAVKRTKKGYQAEAVAEKTSLQWQNVPHKTQKSDVQELALAARKRKSEMVHDEVSAKFPKNRSTTTGSQGHHASKAYIKGAEKPPEHRSFDKILSHYSRRPALPASNVKGSSQRYDEKLSSHMPLGLFMRFPEDFPLPSESQLKAAFIPFGPLQMSATRLYHDSVSAQVVFKHGRDAESAMKHAKKNDMFGPVAVTYRLRHLSHSSKVESKTDAPSSNKFTSSIPVRKPFLTKEKVEGPSASPENRAGDKKAGTSVMLTSSNNAMDSGSEPTGDIQDKMMTLLRQVSVLVKPSPVGSDGT